MMAVQLDAIYGSLVRLKRENACKLEKRFITDQVTQLDSFFSQVYNDLLEGKVTGRLFPISALQSLLNASHQLKNSCVIFSNIVLQSQESLSYQ